ncbi:aspartate aminotransferase family protein [Helicobacter pametensis]|uniref:aspartate aminotransferase family protein n=1 Tax=Helicobacter pametensis TaxID=95149 RepID=UPI0004843B60|nr:aspartate aminotransferase family protein [Helicobacter pametensis]
MKLDEVQTLDHEFVMPTYHRMQVAFERGEGARLFDVEGRDYIDFGSGIGVNSVGYGNPRMINVLCEQAQKLIHTSNLFYIPNQALLAQKLIKLSRMDMNVFFANSGAEANEAMIKLARKYGEIRFPKKRYKIITLQSSFHGRTLATLKATGQEAYHKYFAPFPDGFVIAQNLQDVYQKIDDETCGVMIELIQGEGGICALPQDEVRELAAFLRQHQILLLVDEVQSGVYRTGEFLASHLYGIQPDLISLAKGMGGGITIGAVMSAHKNVFVAGDHGSTFGGNPLSSRVALEVLEILEEEYHSKKLQAKIELFEERLEGLLKRSDIFLKKVGRGLMCGLEARDTQIQQTVISQALCAGVVVLRSGRNVVRFLPPLTISECEIDEGFERLHLLACLDE